MINLMSIEMKVHEVPLTLAEHDSDIKIKAYTKNNSVICNQRLCSLFAQISGERLQDGPLVCNFNKFYNIYSIANWSLYRHVVFCVPVSCSKANRVGNQFRLWRYLETYAKIRN